MLERQIENIFSHCEMIFILSSAGFQNKQEIHIFKGYDKLFQWNVNIFRSVVKQ